MEATVTLSPETLKITYEIQGAKYEIHWPPASLQVMERIYKNKPALIGSKSMLGARLVISDFKQYEEVIKLIPNKNIKLSHVHHPWRTMWIVIAMISIIIILPIWKIHIVSSWIVNMMPYQWEELFWKNMVEPSVSNLNECVAPKGVASLNKLVTRLSQAAQLKHPLQVKIINAPNVINAESFPGYHIFIYSGLLAVDDPDALAAIIAHEMGHSVKQHVLAQYLSKAGLSALFEGIFGLSTNNVAFDFLNLKFIRDYEIQADQFSIKTLKTANIDTAGFRIAMEYLKKVGGEFIGIEPYLVDHPTYQERIELLKGLPDKETKQPCLTPQEWKSLKSICNKTELIKFD